MIQNRGFGYCYFLPFMVPCNEYAINNFNKITIFLKLIFSIEKPRLILSIQVKFIFGPDSISFMI